MSIATVVTEGFGSFATVPYFLPTDGFGDYLTPPPATGPNLLPLLGVGDD